MGPQEKILSINSTPRFRDNKASFYTATIKKLQLKIEILEKIHVDSKSNHQLSLPLSDAIVYVNTENILYAQANSNYTYVFMLDGTKHLISKTLKNFIDEIYDRQFIRIHASYFINLSFLDRYFRVNNNIQLRDGTKLPVSRSRKENLLESMKVVGQMRKIQRH